MPATGTLGLYPKFRADDLQGLPLEGGKLYSYISGTSTPQSLYADAELTTALPNPLVLDSSGEALFYYGPSQYKLALHDAQDVPQWLIDPVAGTGGGAAAAGMGLGSNTVELRPAASAALASTVVFPASVLALGLTVWVEETFGTSQGLTQIGLGTVEHPDCWGVLTTLTADTETHAGMFLAYSGQPMPTDGTVTLTAYGGLFDGTGAVYLTGHFATFAPSHALGLTWTAPGQPSPEPPAPQPYATETTPGVVELVDATEVLADTDTTRALTIGRLVSRPGTPSRLGLLKTATPAAVVTGTNDTDAATPLGVAQALAPVIAVNTTQTSDIAALQAKLPAGTPLSVVRYAVSGTTLEPGSATVVIDATGRLGVGQATPLYPLHVVGELRLEQGLMRAQRDNAPATIQSDAAGEGVNSHYGYLSVARSRGSFAGRTAVQSGDRLGLLTWSGHTGTALSFGAQVDGAAEEAFSTTTLGTRLMVSTAQLGTATLTERLRLDSQGRVGVHTTLSATLGSGASYQPLSVKGSQLFVGQSSTQERAQALLSSSWVVSTDASRTGRFTLSTYDATAAREGLRLEADGSAARLGFYGATAVAKPTVSGSRGGNAALASALTALASLGLLTDSSTA